MDQQTTIGMITAIAITVGLIAQIVLQIMAKYKVAEVAEQAKVAAKAVNEVKRTLSDTSSDTNTKLVGLAQVAEVTRALVNHGFGVLLREKAELLREKADRTRVDTDTAAAIVAEKAYTDHQQKQADVDARAADTKREGTSRTEQQGRIDQQRGHM
jgi:hypothetical protein